MIEPRIQYAKTSDGVSIAYCEGGTGTPFVSVSPVNHEDGDVRMETDGERLWVMTRR